MSFDLPAKAGPARDQSILQHVQSGDFQVQWATITSTFQGHTGTFHVFADALKIGGVRISCSAYLLQQISDLLNSSLLTPKLSDLCFLQAQTPIPPLPISPPSDSTAAMVQESQLIDQALNSVPPPYGLVAPIGKPWCLTNGLLTHPGRACLYGWASAQPLPSVPLFAGVTPGVKVIQPISFAHDINYVDYAQLAVLVAQDCIVDNALTNIAAVMQDPVLSGLVSHEGPLKVTRQPGVPLLKPLPPGGPGGLLNVSLETPVEPTLSTDWGKLVGVGLAFGAAGFLAGVATTR